MQRDNVSIRWKTMLVNVTITNTWQVTYWIKCGILKLKDWNSIFFKCTSIIYIYIFLRKSFYSVLRKSVGSKILLTFISWTKTKERESRGRLKNELQNLFFGFIMPWGFQIHCMAFDQMKIWCRSIDTLRSSPKNVLPLVLHWTNTLSTTLLMPTHFGTDLLPAYCTPFLCVHEKSSLLLMKPLPFLPPSLFLHNW